MTIQTTTLPTELLTWRPTEFPGTIDAQHAGCLCPEQKQWPGTLVFDTDCPVHTEEIRTGFRKYLDMKVQF